MACCHVGQRGEAFEHVSVAKLKMVDDPRRVEIAADQRQGAVHVGDEGAALGLIELIGGHGEAKLDWGHCSLSS